MEDDRVSLLEQQLSQAKLIAEEADKKYEEVGHVTAKQDVSRPFAEFGSELSITLTNRHSFLNFTITMKSRYTNP